MHFLKSLRALWRRVWRSSPTGARQDWEQTWSGPDTMNWNLKRVSRYYVEAWDNGLIKPGDHCLDLGCGVGYNAAWLAEKDVRVLGVDLAQAAIDKSRELHPPTLPLEFLQRDVTAPDDHLGQFDVILDRGCLHGLPIREGYYRNLNSWLKPGGLLLLQHHLRKYSSRQLREEVTNSLLPDCTLISESAIDMFENSNSQGEPGVFLVVRKSAASR